VPGGAFGDDRGDAEADKVAEQVAVGPPEVDVGDLAAGDHVDCGVQPQRQAEAATEVVRGAQR